MNCHVPPAARLAVVALLTSALLSGVALAQTSANGAIRGRVSDEQGGVVPGLTVTAASPTVAGMFTAITDAQGLYRLVDLPPGEYLISAELMGFAKLERPGVVVRAGLNLSVDIVMKIGALTETVQVRQETPMLDVSRPVQAVNIQGELQRALPTSGRRDYTDFLELTPGMNSYVSPSAGGGLYHMRGSRIESHVVQVDGADMGSLRQARPDYIGMSTDTLEDVEVKSAVSDASAPLGNGAVMNIATPTGSNVIRGSMSTGYTNRDWHANNNPGGETNSSSLALVDVSGGTPIVRDRMWLFGSFRKIDRQIGLGGRNDQRIALARAIHGSGWSPFDNAIKVTNYFVKGTTQLGRHRVEGFYQYDMSPKESNYFESTLNAAVSVFGGSGYSARVSSLWGRSVTTRFGIAWNNKTINGNVSNLDGYFVSNIPERPVHLGSFISGATRVGDGMFVNAGIEDNYDVTPSQKLTINGDLTYYRSGWLGSHELQVGVYLQPRMRGGTTLYYANGGRATEDYVVNDRNNFAAGITMFHYRVYDPAQIETSRVTASDNAFYIQDAWKVSNRMTVTGGVRLDQVKSRDEFVDVETQNSLEIGPRFGATYVLTADQNNILYASWGRVHDLVGLGDIPTLGSATAGFTDYYDNDLNGTFETQFVTPGGTTTSNTRRIDRDRHQPFIDEWTAGYRRQFAGQIAVSAGFARRVYKDRPAQVEVNGIYDGVEFKGYGALDPNVNTIFLFTNDVWNSQVYEAIETSFTKRGEKLQLISSYVRQWRHLSGTWQPNDVASFVQPEAFPNNRAIGTPRQAPSNSLPPGGADVFGNTAWQDHTFRFSALYTLPYGFDFGAHYVYQSGPYTGPIVDRIAAADPRFGPAQVVGPTGRRVANPLATTIRFKFATRGEGQVKADARQELNLKVTKRIKLNRYTVEFGGALYNLTNQGAIERWSSGAGQFYSSGNYLAPTSLQPPRSYELNAKFSF